MSRRECSRQPPPTTSPGVLNPVAVSLHHDMEVRSSQLPSPLRLPRLRTRLPPFDTRSPPTTLPSLRTRNRMCRMTQFAPRHRERHPVSHSAPWCVSQSLRGASANVGEWPSRSHHAALEPRPISVGARTPSGRLLVGLRGRRRRITTAIRVPRALPTAFSHAPILLGLQRSGRAAANEWHKGPGRRARARALPQVCRKRPRAASEQQNNRAQQCGPERGVLDRGGATVASCGHESLLGANVCPVARFPIHVDSCSSLTLCEFLPHAAP
jgi:hypothetical protein